jgi:hypothetical protein
MFETVLAYEFGVQLGFFDENTREMRTHAAVCLNVSVNWHTFDL